MRAKRATTKARLFVTGAAAVFMLAGCMDSHNLVAPDEAAVNLSRDNASNIIPGRFIVTVRPGADPAAVAESYGVDPQYVYSRVMNGFAGSISDAARSGLLRDSRVLRVTPDKEIFEDPMADFPVSRRGNGARFSQADLEGIMNPAGPTPLLSLYQERIQLLAGALTRSVAGVLSGPPAAWASTIGTLSLASTTPTSDLTVQEDAPWALDRIDQRALPLDGEYGYADDGAGVTVYVISSGIRDSHSEIAGRVTLGRDLSGRISTGD